MNWALVIGCDLYWTPQANLHGAVRDALKMYRWITSDDGGKVPLENVRLLLSPSSAGEQVPADIPFADATNGAIQLTLGELVVQSGGSGDRLFVYFSGHGLSGRINGIDEPAIAPADFRLELTDRAISIRSIYEYFATTQIGEQYFFFDACRNIPLRDEFIIGQVSRPRRTDYSLRSPEQFVCFATSRGLVAAELQEAGNERGIFTEALLDGLGGAGDAKRWDADLERYTVRWNQLFEHVHEAVVATKTSIGPGLQSDLIQQPIQTGEHSTNPTLAEFADESFGPQVLTVSIDPAVAATTATVTILRPDQADDDSFGPPAETPRGVPLPPRSYTIRGRAAGFHPRRRSWPVDLYVPRDVVVEFDAGEPPQPDQTVRGRGFGEDPILTVRSDDPVAVVQIHDDAGSLVDQGAGKTEVRRQGWLSARALTPDGIASSERVEVDSGEHQVVDFELARPASRMAEVLLSDLAHDGENLVASLGGAGAITMPSAVTLGVIAAGRALVEGNGATRSSSLPPLSMDDRGHILIIDERAKAPGLAKPQLEVRSGLGTTELPELRLGTSGAIGATSFDGQPGPYQVTVRSLLDSTVTVPFHLFSGRRSLLVIHLDETGRPLVLQFASTFFDGASPSGLLELRRFESAQRFMAKGEPALAHVLMRAAEPSFDPLADCLTAYLGLRFERDPRAGWSLKELADDSGLPDAVLLDGYLGGGYSHRYVEEAAAKAMSLGPPVFDFGLTAAVDALKGASRQQSPTDFVSRRLPGQVITTLVGENEPEIAFAGAPALTGV